MSTENEIVEPVDQDLDDFAAELFGQKKAAPEPASSEAEDKVAEESDAQEDHEDDTLETEDTSDAEEPDDKVADSDEDKPQPKKNRFQERIDELNGKFREEQRQRQALEAKIEELSKKQTSTNERPIRPQEVNGPTVDDKDENGEEKYPLGDFDPNYIRDLTKFTLKQEQEAMRAEAAKAEQQKAYETEKAQLQTSWTEKVGPAKERYPDFQDKGEQLFDTFSSIDQNYGEYLSATLMSMDHGPDVLYYLANNLDEANKIVASGPTKATLALGRIEAKFATAEMEKQLARPKVSNAPTPPSRVNKGSAAAMPDVPDDTDDLDAFSDKLFKPLKKR